MTPIPTERVRELRDKYTQLAAQYQEMDLPKSRDQWLDLAAMASEILTRRDAEAREGWVPANVHEFQPLPFNNFHCAKCEHSEHEPIHGWLKASVKMFSLKDLLYRTMLGDERFVMVRIPPPAPDAKGEK